MQILCQISKDAWRIQLELRDIRDYIATDFRSKGQVCRTATSSHYEIILIDIRYKKRIVMHHWYSFKNWMHQLSSNNMLKKQSLYILACLFDWSERNLYIPFWTTQNTRIICFIIPLQYQGNISSFKKNLRDVVNFFFYLKRMCYCVRDSPCCSKNNDIKTPWEG